MFNIMSFIGKGNCKVYCRIFPVNNTGSDLIKIKNSLLSVKSLHDSSQDTNISKFWMFKHDEIFTNDSQEFLYSTITNGLIDRVLKGFNGIIIGYGQTGSGKSFTMNGLDFSEKEFGVAPRIIRELFNIMNVLPSNIKMHIEMSYVEFSKLIVVDLLKSFPNFVDAWHVKTASKILVKSEYDALKLLYRGEGRKSFAKCNEYLSHIGSSVLTFHITKENIEFSNPERISSRLHIVDMAGIDSVGNASSYFKNDKDVGKANIIKSDMEQFMTYLIKNDPRLIQFKERTNPLIYYLGGDLSSENVLRFIGHVKIQYATDLKISMSTLRFGQAIKGLKPKMKEIVCDITEEIKIQYLQNKLECLKREQIFHSVLLNQDLTRDLNQERIEHLQATVDGYLHNRITELTILNVAEASEALRILKGHCVVEADQVSDLGSAKKRNSKTTSGILLEKPKKTKKSRDSLLTLEKAKKASSFESLRGKISIHVHRKQSNRGTEKGLPLQDKRVRASIAGKQSSIVVSRRSTISSSIKDKSSDSKGFSTETALLPDILPSYQKMWNVFIGDSKGTYKHLQGALKANETELKHVYLTYQKEITKLQQCKELVEKRKTEQLEATMYLQFISKSSSDPVTTDFRQYCKENLDIAQTKLLDQQELVLKTQGELKLYLTNRKEIKAKIQEDFSQYCKDHYKIVVPNLPEDEEETIMTEETLNMEFKNGEKDIVEEENLNIVKSSQSKRLEVFKKIMEKELHKTIKLKELRNRCWKNWL